MADLRYSTSTGKNGTSLRLQENNRATDRARELRSVKHVSSCSQVTPSDCERRTAEFGYAEDSTKNSIQYTRKVSKI
jgi:hypothetical protein